MRVLAFTDIAWPEGSGGVERTLFEIYPRLVAAGQAEVRLVTLAGDGLPRQESHAGVVVLRARRLPLERLTGLQVAVSAEVWRVGMRAAREFRPDLIHAHTLYYHSSLVAAAVARRFGVPLVLTLHIGAVGALPQPRRALVEGYERIVGRALLASARRVICVSEDVRRHARSLGVPESRLAVVPNGVDLRRYTPHRREPDGPPVVLCVGRLIVNKGPHHLLEAVARLAGDGVPLRLVYAGDGPMAAGLRRRAVALGLGDRVTLLGQRSDVEALLARADIVVPPSLTEGMSLAVLEAMAAGLPVVVADVSGMRQLIDDGVDGLVTRPGSVPDLVAATRRLASDRPLRTMLGVNARRRALAYDWPSVATATAAEFRCARS